MTDDVTTLIEFALMANDHLPIRQRAEAIVEALALDPDSVVRSPLGTYSWMSDGSTVNGRIWRVRGLEYEPADPS